MNAAIVDQRRQPVQERARRTVAQILDAALVLFEEGGYTATPMSAIADRAGIGIASLYQWFPTKEDVLLGLAERHLNEAAAVLGEVAVVLREEMPPLGATVERFVRAAIDLHADEARFHRQMFESCPRTPPIAALLADVDAAVAVELVWHLRRLGLARGDVALRAALVVSAVQAAIHEVVLARPAGPDREAAVNEVVAMVVGYLGVGAHRRR